MSNLSKQIHILKKIRTMREEKKERALVERKNAERKVEQKHQTTEEARSSWQKDMPHKEEELFSHVKGQNLNKRQLDEWRYGVQQLQEKEHHLLGEEQDAAKEHQNSTQETKTARTSYRQALKERNKTDELATDIKKQEQLAINRKEDSELDEFATTRYKRKSPW